MTLEAAQQAATAKLRGAGIDSARLDTLLLLEKVLDKPRSWVLAHGDELLDESALTEFTALIDRRAKRHPLVHLTNHREFYGLDLYINEDVLTPRVETEKMVEYAIRYTPKNGRLIDIGTGSGAIAIAIKKHRPDLTVMAADISEKELAVARRNDTTHKTEVEFMISDLFSATPDTFDTVVCNLPYLRDDADLMPEVQKEPRVALVGGEDGLDIYRRFLAQLPDHLKPQGFLFTECDPWQHEALIDEAKTAGLHTIEKNDYFILGFQR